MKKRIVWISGLAVVALLTGCILTGTFVTTYTVAPDENGDPIYISYADLEDCEFEVVLTDDGDFEDHKDKIKDIDNVGFYLDVTNLGSDVDTFQIFVESDSGGNWHESGMNTIIDSASYLFLTDLIIPPDSRKVIDWNQSLSYITDLGNVKPIIESGLFSIYVVALPRESFNIRVDSLVAIVTFTAGK